MVTSDQAVSLLAEYDQGFQTICKTLYPGMSPDQVWDVVYKYGPGQSDLAVPGSASNSTVKRIKPMKYGVLAKTTVNKGIMGRLAQTNVGGSIGQFAIKHAVPLKVAGLAGTGAGALLATGETVKGVKNMVAPSQGTNRTTGAKQAAIGGTSLAGDAAATLSILGDSVGKGESFQLHPVETLKQGYLAQSQALSATPAQPKSKTGGPTKPATAGAPNTPQPPAPVTSAGKAPTPPTAPKPPKVSKGMKADAGSAAGKMAGKAAFGLIGTNTRKAGTAATVAAAALVHHGYKGYMQRKEQAQYWAPQDTSFYKFEGTFSKFDNPKKQAFGFASVVEVDGKPIIDKQGDLITEEDLEKAAYDFMQNSRVGGDMHERAGDDPRHVSDVIESMVFTKEKIQALGLPSDFPVSWWIGVQYKDDAAWEDVAKNKRVGFSIHGKGRRVPISEEELWSA